MFLLEPILNQLTALFAQLTPIPLENALGFVYTIGFNILLFLAWIGGLGG